jgi:hypothetical protein
MYQIVLMMEVIMNTTPKHLYRFASLTMTALSGIMISTSIFAADAAPSFAGSYQCKRVDASNNTNTYPLEIINNGNTYTFEWMDANGFPLYYGTGITHPTAPTLAIASFFDPKNPSAFGVEFFKIKPDNSLQSNWVLQQSNQVGSETCTRSK